MAEFHFLRPAWFLALLPLAALLALLWRRHLASGSWRAVVDPQLLPHLLVGSAQRRSPWAIAAIGLGGLLAITALAGPVWNKLEQPVFRRDSALVVLLDLSRSMDATDVAPSRLQMAKFKLRDILARRKEGDTALVVYAADPFTVTPLTNDVDNIALQLPVLTTDLMPAQGSRADRAIAQAQALLRQAGALHGDVLLITDGVDNTPSGPLHEAVRHLVDAGYRLSVLGVGTPEGAPIPLAGGGFYLDGNGAMVVAKLDEQALAQLAAAGHGIYRRLVSGSDSDTDALTATFASDLQAQQSKRVTGMRSDQWREQGPWLLLPLLALAALAFRRGYLALLVFALWLPLPRSAYAFDWGNLWQRPDQRGAAAMAAHQPQQAAKLFQNPQWRAAAHYRAGDYQAMLDDLRGRNDSVTDYNRGNALAHLGKLPEAMNAYDEALKKDPTLADAKYNRDLVRKWLKPPQQQQQKSGGKGNPQQQQGAGGKPQENGKSQQQGGQQQKANGQGNKQQQGGASQPNGNGKEQQADTQHNDGDKPSAQQQPQRAQQQPSKQSSGAAQSKTNGTDDERARHNQGAQQSSQERPQGAPQQAGEATQPQSESEQATEQWLRRIPDDPGGLWRRKFLYQYKREYQSQQSEAKPW